MPATLRFRTMLIALLSGASIPSGTVVAQFSEGPLVKVHQFPEAGLRLIGPSSPDFRLQLRLLESRGELATPDNFALLPFSVLIANDGGREIAAATIIFKGTSSKGETTTRQQTFYSLDKTDPPTLFLAPGQTRLLTPSSEVNGELFTSQPRIESISVARHLEWCTRQGEIDVSVDAAIDTQGEITGPDVAHMQQRLNAQIAAIEDLAKGLRSQHLASAATQGEINRDAHPDTKNNIGTWLRHLSSADLSGDFKSTWEESYLHTQQSYAQIFLNTIDAKGIDYVIDTLIPHILDDRTRIPKIHRPKQQ